MSVSSKGSAWYHGALYARFVDPWLQRTRRLVSRLVEPGCSILEVGCGTGALARELEDECSRIVAVDRSARMIDYARHNKGHREDRVKFLLADAAELRDRVAGPFDYAVSSMVLHALEPDVRRRVLAEMQALACRLIIAEADPARQNVLQRLMHQLAEAMAGVNHYHAWRSFMRAGGLDGLVRQTGLSVDARLLDSQTGVKIVCLTPR